MPPQTHCCLRDWGGVGTGTDTTPTLGSQAQALEVGELPAQPLLDGDVGTAGQGRVTG